MTNYTYLDQALQYSSLFSIVVAVAGMLVAIFAQIRQSRAAKISVLQAKSNKILNSSIYIRENIVSSFEKIAAGADTAVEQRNILEKLLSTEVFLKEVADDMRDVLKDSTDATMNENLKTALEETLKSETRIRQIIDNLKTKNNKSDSSTSVG